MFSFVLRTVLASSPADRARGRRDAQPGEPCERVLREGLQRRDLPATLPVLGFASPTSQLIPYSTSMIT